MQTGPSWSRNCRESSRRSLVGRLYFEEIDESGTLIERVFENSALVAINGTFEVTGSVAMAAGRENLRIGIRLAKFADDLDAGSGIGQIVETELEEGTAIFIFALGGAVQLARGRQAKGFTQMRGKDLGMDGIEKSARTRRGQTLRLVCYSS